MRSVESVPLYVHIYIHTHVYIYIYIYIHTHTHIYVCAVDMGHFIDVKREYEHANKWWLDAKTD